MNVNAVIAKSIERIHHSNLINFGILPLVFINEEDYDGLDQNDILRLEDLINSLEEGRPVVVNNETKGRKFKASYTLSDRDVEIIKVGGLLSFIKKNRKNRKNI